MIGIDEVDFNFVYRIAIRKFSNTDRTESGKFDRIYGRAILEALFELGLVDEDNNPKYNEL